MKSEDIILQIAEKFQRDCHAHNLSNINKNSNITVQDVTNVWIYKKMAEFEFRLQKMENIK